MDQKQPKIVQKLLLRTFILLLAVAGVFLGIQWVLDWRKDADAGTSDTNGMIAALEILDEGQRAVIFDSAGNKVPSPEYASGKTDRDIVWRPDGNRLFFTSDRKEGAFHLFRWNIGKGTVDQRSTGTLSKFDPSFPTVTDYSDKAEVEAAGNTALLTQGGFVLAFDIRETSSQQLLPRPSGVSVAEEGGGGAGQFDALYKRYGNSFRSARWAGNGEYVAAIMKGDEGEVFIVQKLEGSTAEDAMPRAYFGGDRIDMDVDPKTGRIVVTVLNFQFPDLENIPRENIKNGRSVKPFLNGVFAVDPTKVGQASLTPIALSNDLKMSFGAPAVSPDGTQIAITTGSYDGATFAPAGLALMPLQAGGMQSGKPIVGGRIFEVSWHPNGETLTYIKRLESERAIFKINKDGSTETKVSTGGDYMTPKFSPQSK
jgi:Tol biopolymer transport system component